VLRSRQISGALLPGIERIVKLAKFDVQTFDRDPSRQFVDYMSELMANDLFGRRRI